MILNIKDETAPLKSVVLGRSESIGRVPTLEETFDSKSYETVKNNSYPLGTDIIKEMQAFEDILLKYGVEILKPELIEDCNQIYARDVAFVIDDKIINSNIIPDREYEKEAYTDIYREIAYNKIYNLPERVHIEGGDVILCDDNIFVGTYKGKDYPNYSTARTNAYAIDFMRELFPSKNFIPIELVKHDTNPYEGVLHLDCTFMPVSKSRAIIYKEGFLNKSEYEFVVDFFGRDNIFEITKQEMYYMNTNIFSISPSVVVSEDNFTRLNNHMTNEWGLTVETVPYREVSKMGGLFRCSTLPLIREYE